MNAEQTPPRRPRRGGRWLAAGLLALLVAGGVTVRHYAQPDALAHLILDRAGKALDLHIVAGSGSRYALRGLPMLEVREVVARDRHGDVVLASDRVLVAIPWHTLRARGATLDVQRIELDRPRLHLPAFLRWQATRPPSTTPLPTLRHGLHIVDGSVIGEGFRIDRLTLTLPHFAAEVPVRAPLRAQARFGDIRMRIDGALAMTRPSRHAGVAYAGFIELATAEWTLPLHIRLSAPLQIHDDRVVSDRLRVAAHGRLVTARQTLPIAWGLTSPILYAHGALGLAPLGLALRGGGPLPDLQAHGRIGVGTRLLLALDGTLPHWPRRWPALPQPLAASASPLPFRLDYLGGSDLADVLALQLRRDATVFDARLRLPQLLTWLDAGASPSPLPPLDGTLTTPRLLLDGVRLEGVQVRIDDPDVPASQ